MGPAYPAWSTASRIRRSAITPSPITPRFISTSCTGTSQSETWKPTIRPAVVLDPRLPLRVARRRKHPSAAHARHTQPGVADQAHGAIESSLGKLVAPHGDVRHAVPRARFDRFRETRPVRGDLVEAEPLDPRGPRGPQGPRACARG